MELHLSKKINTIRTCTLAKVNLKEIHDIIKLNNSYKTKKSVIHKLKTDKTETSEIRKFDQIAAISINSLLKYR